LELANHRRKGMRPCRGSENILGVL
jgi:hypothetical protein